MATLFFHPTKSNNLTLEAERVVRHMIAHSVPLMVHDGCDFSVRADQLSEWYVVNIEEQKRPTRRVPKMQEA